MKKEVYVCDNPNCKEETEELKYDTWIVYNNHSNETGISIYHEGRDMPYTIVGKFHFCSLPCFYDWIGTLPNLE